MIAFSSDAAVARRAQIYSAPNEEMHYGFILIDGGRWTEALTIGRYQITVFGTPFVQYARNIY